MEATDRGIGICRNRRVTADRSGAGLGNDGEIGAVQEFHLERPCGRTAKLERKHALTTRSETTAGILAIGPNQFEHRLVDAYPGDSIVDTYGAGPDKRLETPDARGEVRDQNPQR
jgi:hypothetical protein